MKRSVFYREMLEFRRKEIEVLIGNIGILSRNIRVLSENIGISSGSIGILSRNIGIWLVISILAYCSDNQFPVPGILMRCHCTDALWKNFNR